jgi:hypothetical protein
VKLLKVIPENKSGPVAVNSERTANTGKSLPPVIVDVPSISNAEGNPTIASSAINMFPKVAAEDIKDDFDVSPNEAFDATDPVQDTLKTPFTVKNAKRQREHD